MYQVQIFINTLDPSKAKLLDYAFTLKGYEVCEMKEVADIIIIDFALYRIQKGPMGVTPVIVLGTNSDEEDILEGIYQFCSDYVIEPFEISELEMLIEKNLSRRFLMQTHSLPPQNYI